MTENMKIKRMRQEIQEMVTGKIEKMTEKILKKIQNLEEKTGMDRIQKIRKKIWGMNI